MMIYAVIWKKIIDLLSDRWTATEEGLTCALDLVRYIRRKYDDYFCIGVAGYPEGYFLHTI